MEGAFASTPLSRKRQIEDFKQRLFRRPADYQQDSTANFDVAIEHMVEQVDTLWSKHFWYRWFLKRQLGLLRYMMGSLFNTAHPYIRPLTHDEQRLVETLIHDSQLLDAVNTLVKDHEIYFIESGDCVITHRISRKCVGRGSTIRGAVINYHLKLEQEIEDNKPMELQPIEKV